MSGRGDSRAGGDRTPSPVRDRSQRAGTDSGYDRGTCECQVENEEEKYNRLREKWKVRDAGSKQILQNIPGRMDEALANLNRQYITRPTYERQIGSIGEDYRDARVDMEQRAQKQERRDRNASKHDESYWKNYWEAFGNLIGTQVVVRSSRED